LYGEEQAESRWSKAREARALSPALYFLRQAACEGRKRAATVKAFVKLVKVIDSQSLSSALSSCLLADHADVRETARNALVAVASRGERDTNAKRIVISVLSRFALPGELVASESSPTNEEMQTILSRAVDCTLGNSSLERAEPNVDTSTNWASDHVDTSTNWANDHVDCDSISYDSDDVDYYSDFDCDPISYHASPKDLSMYAYNKRMRDRLTSARRSCRSMARQEREIRQNRPWLLHRRNMRGHLAKFNSARRPCIVMTCTRLGEYQQLLAT